jgi:O-antigen/teichoic acid export membrane protein
VRFPGVPTRSPSRRFDISEPLHGHRADRLPFERPKRSCGHYLLRVRELAIFMEELRFRRRSFTRPASDELKRKSVRGGFVAIAAQGGKVLLQTGTLMLLARLLSPDDFGLIGMATTLTGFLSLFRDAGLSAATVQRLEVTHEQISTLFWINLAVGVGLAACTVLLAPALVRFYGEPRLYWITIVTGATFIFNGLAAQHGALISREMRFATQARIDLTALAVSSAVGIVMAFLGWRYWSLVGMAMVGPIVSAAGVLRAVPWVPGPPRRGVGVRSMLRFGGLATCNSFLVFLAWNSDNILLGRFWGAHVLGLYGRAYQLATLPVEQLTSTLSGVAISGLSAVQDDADRFSRSFLSGYSLLVSATIPIAIACLLFADQIIYALLGDKWTGVAPIFRLLAPTSLVFALANPLSWLIMARGRVGRAVTITATTTPVVIIGILLGLRSGPTGVAIGYSAAMALILIPITAWSIHGTGIAWSDLWNVIRKPLLGGVLAGAVGLGAKIAFGGGLVPILVLVLGVGLVFSVYAGALVAMGQKKLYLDLLTELFSKGRSNKDESALQALD